MINCKIGGYEDFYKKILVVNENIVTLQAKICGKPQKSDSKMIKTDEQGIVTISLMDFLLDENSISPTA